MAKDRFVDRHIGPRATEITEMLQKIGVNSADELINQTIPQHIRLKSELRIDNAISEIEFLAKIKKIASANQIFRTYIGLGYYNNYTPAVIQRNILENPAWYTSYTPYQAEISQGRLEAMLNFQTMVSELTALPMANASLLDEATAVAEAMLMAFHIRSKEQVKAGANKYFVDKNVFPQTIDVLKTRAIPLGIDIVFGHYQEIQLDNSFFGVLVQFPNALGEVSDYKDFVSKAKAVNAFVVVATDLLSLTLLTPPGEWGADVVCGSSQRMGLPMGFGGPHAGFFATREEYKRFIPGRIIGVSKDANGKPALRMALQTREQHIKREKATSNICTSQALLAVMSGMYGVYHGPDGLKSIASTIHLSAVALEKKLRSIGFYQSNTNYFDTLLIHLPDGITAEQIRKIAIAEQINFNYIDSNNVGITLDETTSIVDLNDIAHIFAVAIHGDVNEISELPTELKIDAKLVRGTEFMSQHIFHKYRSETEMMRYIKRLERKDLSLVHSMISLGSCTMKLNAAAEMLPLSWPEFGAMHPFVPHEQAKGYYQLFNELVEDLKAITGFDDVSLQPNSGSAGEYAGLMTIRAFHLSNGDAHRTVCLIPSSAHGTNPASAVMAGFEVVIVKCDENGNIDLTDLYAKAEKYKDTLGAFMVTYPSTHGVFESAIMDMCNVIHSNGGQVYMDGANMNAQVGYTSPAAIGADVCHLNLHKTFAIPHGGGGPGVGPIAVAKHLVDFLPGHAVVNIREKAISAVSAAPYGSASILPISYGYIKMLGADGLKYATKMAILNANYMAASLKDYYNILYKGENGRVGHEMILDCRPFKSTTGIAEIDIAKRLMDYGFHAPTVSFPVHGTLMVEPTESESKAELDRFIEAMISIYNEMMEIKDGKADKEDNVLKNAPHTESMLLVDEWNHSYSRQKAAYPLAWVAESKFWPSVTRIDDAYGDRNLFCTCLPLEEYAELSVKAAELNL
jgi:glycine dehydrogenase